MYPETLFVIFGYHVNLYRLIILVGACALLPLAWRLGRERAIRGRVVFFGWAIAIASALIGGYTLPRIGYSYSDNLPFSWSLGAIIATVLSTSAYFLCLGTVIRHRRQALDVLAPCLAFSFVLGRLACFSVGCCNGAPALGLPWSVTFADPLSASNYKNIPVHPTQLYESAGSLLILILILARFNHPNWKGSQIWVFAAAYGVLRLANEFFRGDVRTMIGVLSLNQWVCLAAISISSIVLITHWAPLGNRRVAVAK